MAELDPKEHIKASSSQPTHHRSLLDNSAPPNAATKIFRESCNGFRSLLSDEHRSLFIEYPDAKSMLVAIEQQVASHSVHRNVLSRCCRRIDDLSKRLTPFFKVVDIFVSSNPEYAAIAWGSIRLVFLLASNHTQFIEKICDMFDTMRCRLPAYEQFVDEFAQIAPRLNEAANGRLRRALAYIYSDLIQFCYDICKLFSRRRSKFLSFPGSFLYSSLWKPFDFRFDTLLKRWKEHKDLIELELKVSANIQQLQTNTILEEKLKRIEEGYVQDKRELDSDEVLRRLSDWISSPPWMHLFDSAQDRRAANSTEWFMRHPSIVEWIEGSTNPKDGSFQCIHVSAKPGYGKTTLCTTLIESVQRSLSNLDSEKNWLAYFYFDKQRQENVQSTAAWRSILTQLLHIFPGDQDIIDASLILRDGLAPGHPVALNREILAVLKVILAQFNHLYLVFDGVDECVDQDRFFDDLKDVCRSSRSSSVALFSRPIIIVPKPLKDYTTQVPLDTSQNLKDIKNFLRSSMSKLSEASALPRDLDPETVVVELSTRANGMFLWARLFVEYICSPNLSVRQRRDAIQNTNRFDDLDCLFGAILQALLRGNKDVAKSNIVKALKVVAFAHRALHSDELMYAIAIPLDRPVDVDDTIPNFADNLGHLSGALLELDGMKMVRFIHLSVLEYLVQSSGTRKSRNSSPDLGIECASSHRLCASVSLSYLSITVRSAPLAGTARSIPDVKEQVCRYPFLSYATEFWSHHVIDYLDRIESFPADDEDRELLRLASKFLSNKASIMVWIEASWMFNNPPRIREGPGDTKLQRYSKAMRPADIALNPVLERAYQGLLQLARHLESLNSSWQHILSKEPNEIWEPNISAFNPSPFWTRVPGSIVTPFDVHHDEDIESICVKSRVSQNGSHLAIARLYISNTDTIRLGKAQFFFERWTTSPVDRLFELAVEISESQMSPFLVTYSKDLGCADSNTTPLHVGSPYSEAYKHPNDHATYSFEFAVEITEDLKRVVVPGSITQVNSCEDMRECLAPKATTQQLDFMAVAEQKAPIKMEQDSCLGSYDIQMSDNGGFLVTIHKLSGQLVELKKGLHTLGRLVTVYQDKGLLGRPKYEWIASLIFKPRFDPDDNEANGCALLHPVLPLIAIKFNRYVLARYDHRPGGFVDFPEGSDGGLWDFSPNREWEFKPTRIHLNGPLCFQSNGNAFYGIRLTRQDWDRVPNARPAYHRETIIEGRSSNIMSRIRGPWGSSVIHSKGGNHGVQRQGDIVHSVDHRGRQQASQLGFGENGDVVLGTLRDDGVMSAEMLTRLPSWAFEDREASLLNVADDRNGRSSGAERKVLISPANKPFKQHHLTPTQHARARTTNSPMIITRKRKTIPTTVVHARPALDGSVDLVGEARKRLCYTDSHRKW